MTREQIWNTIADAMMEEFELEAPQMKPTAHIRDDLGLDSLDVVDMVIVLENAFRFKIEDKSRLRDIRTLGDVTDFIESIVEAEKAKAAG